MEKTVIIDWTSAETTVLLNPRLPREQADDCRRAVARAPKLSAHLWLVTSGTSGRSKLVALGKEQFLFSARVVNALLESTNADCWALTLPTFHVAGLAVLARAATSGAKVVALASWDPERFVALCCDKKTTLASLVPAQVFDLVRRHLPAPKSLRTVLIGGGQLAPQLLQAARSLNWPLLPVYGTTECCSMIAAGETLELLSHLEARVTNAGLLEFRSPTLFTTMMIEEKKGMFVAADPKRDGWWRSADRGAVQGRTIFYRGRADDVVKIGGESTDLVRLEQILTAAELASGFPGRAALIAVPDERLGTVIHLAVAGCSTAEANVLQATFDRDVLPFERARRVHLLADLPRTSLEKPLRVEILAVILRR